MDDLLGHIIIFLGCLAFGITCLAVAGAPGVVRGLGVFCLVIVAGQIIYAIGTMIKG
jgi:hypothetical protein